MAVIKTTLLRIPLFCLGLYSGFVDARDKPLTSVADLRYGVALYEYHLDDYMSALTELLLAKKRGGIAGHGDNPEIMEGGLALGYSMERYASSILERLLAENRSQAVQDAAWFYMARLRYQYGDWQRSQEALNKLSNKLPRALRLDANALTINLLLKRDETEQAAIAFNELELAENWYPYFNFNIGSAYARERDFATAVDYFNELATEAYQGEEYRTLYDKAMTAAGYSYLFQQDYEQAMTQFARVRLSSNLSNRALLGYGWAAAELGNYEEALRPWLHLSESELVDENNQEALIAVPYAYEKLGNEGLALQSYQKAEKSFTNEVYKIDEILNSIANEELLTALEINARGQLDWLNIAEENQLSPQLSYLVSLFSRDAFQGSVKQLQDLLALKKSLLDWQYTLGFYVTMLDERETRRVEQAEYLQISELEERIATMRAERATMQRKVERIAVEKDYMALASEDEKPLIKRLQRSKKNLERLREKDPFVDEYQEALRRYEGLLMWQASEAYSDRLWQAIKMVNSLDSSLADVTDTQRRVDSTMKSANDLEIYRSRIAAANTSIDTLLAQLESLINQSEGDLKLQIMDLLREQRVRLMGYLSQSRLSVARLYDKALQTHQEQQFEESKQRGQTHPENTGDGQPEDKPNSSLLPGLEAVPVLPPLKDADSRSETSTLEEAEQNKNTTEEEAL